MAETNFTRRCIKCGVEKPEFEFNRNKSKSGGRNYECRACCVEYRKAYRAANKEKLKANDAAYYAGNKEHVAKIVASYREANSERLKKAVAEYRVANADVIDAYQAEYRVRYKNENPEKYAAAKKAWAKANPEAIRLKGQRRRFKTESAGRLSKGLATKLLKLQQGLCACCGKSLADGYHIDHIMPVALGGTNTDDNIQLLTPLCNMRKGSMHPDEYMNKRRLELNAT
jgi:5-methylcytosine-specific restriction endonuclease McrA